MERKFGNTLSTSPDEGGRPNMYNAIVFFDIKVYSSMEVV